MKRGTRISKKQRHIDKSIQRASEAWELLSFPTESLLSRAASVSVSVSVSETVSRDDEKVIITTRSVRPPVTEHKWVKRSS